MPDRIDIVTEGAKAKFGLPADWKMFQWEWAGKDAREFLVLTGAVCTATFKRGRRKGEDNYASRDRSTEVSVTLTRGDIDGILAAYEHATGKCHECQGTKEEWVGWTREQGSVFRPCKRCGASGKAPSPPSVAA